MSMVIKNLPALQLRDLNPFTVWSWLKMESTVAIQSGGPAWLNDRGNDREVIEIGGWIGRGSDTKGSLGCKKQNSKTKLKAQDYDLTYSQHKNNHTISFCFERLGGKKPP